MLIQIDKTELGDQKLNEVENLAKLKEGNEKLRQKLRIPGQEELEDADKALGHPMSYTDLIFLLQKVNRSIVIQDGGIRGAVAVKIPTVLDDGTYGLKYCTGFYKTILPEFSHISVDDKGLPLRENRGWRTVVLALIKQGVITYKDAVDVFGEPQGQRAGRWQQLLKHKR